jgi:hypothetical protein
LNNTVAQDVEDITAEKDATALPHSFQNCIGTIITAVFMKEAKMGAVTGTGS